MSWCRFLRWRTGAVNNEEELQEMVKKVIDDFAALNENEAYAESKKNLQKLLEQSKEPGFIMYTRLDEILS